MTKKQKLSKDNYYVLIAGNNSGIYESKERCKEKKVGFTHTKQKEFSKTENGLAQATHFLAKEKVIYEKELRKKIEEEFALKKQYAFLHEERTDETLRKELENGFMGNHIYAFAELTIWGELTNDYKIEAEFEEIVTHYIHYNKQRNVEEELALKLNGITDFKQFLTFHHIHIAHTMKEQSTIHSPSMGFASYKGYE